MWKNVTLKQALRAMNLPNLFTMSRLLLVPVMFMCLFYQFKGYAGMELWTKAILVIIIISDFLDGFLARWLDQMTPLGSVLDPLADKLFVLTSYILLAVFQKMPVWLSIIVVAKDILVVCGWFIMMLMFHQYEIRPTLLGKTATAFQFFTVCGIIFFPNAYVLNWLYYLTSIVTILALIHYGFRLSVQAQEHNSEIG